jgi:hypothetical protein
MPSPLEDLDELTLRCRDQKARVYISEAVASYKAGAFRSSIVACWVAVCFDFIEKIRELALSGDKEAEKQVQELDAMRRDGDVTRALKFERDLLKAASNFELISPLECIDLARLQEDRNRCAHPSLTSDDQAYSPSAELARLHIHSAVTHFLQHPPAQGKYALNRVLSDVDSDYFPITAKEARIALASGPLKRPRDSLIRNFVLVLVKSLLKGSSDYKRKLRLTAALTAVKEMHTAISAAVLKESISQLIRALPDTSLSAAIHFARDVNDSWQYFDPDVAQRLQNFVRNLPPEDFSDLEFLLRFPPLRKHARDRLEVATAQDISTNIFFEMPSEVVDRLIDIYLSSRSFAEANSCAKEMMLYLSDFTESHARKILQGINANTQVSGSVQVGALIAALREKKKIPLDQFEALLQESGLEKFMQL